MAIGARRWYGTAPPVRWLGLLLLLSLLLEILLAVVVNGESSPRLLRSTTKRKPAKKKKPKHVNASTVFNIQLRFLDKVPVGLERHFKTAVKRLQRVIVEDYATVVCFRKGDVFCGYKFKQKTCVDDVMVFISTKIVIDGLGGVLSQAAPCTYDVDKRVRLGYLVLDKTDLKGLMKASKAVDVITHELIHVLGFGARWKELNLVTPEEAGPALYLGRYGNEGLISLGAKESTIRIAEGENDAETDRGHFSESHYGNELMTGSLDFSSREMAPLSKMTVGALKDLGFTTIDVSEGGEPYSLPSVEAHRELASSARLRYHKVSYMNDVLRLPVQIVQSQFKPGRTKRHDGPN